MTECPICEKIIIGYNKYCSLECAAIATRKNTRVKQKRVKTHVTDVKNWLKEEWDLKEMMKKSKRKIERQIRKNKR